MITCPECKKEVEKLTKDHVIPRWFLGMLNSHGLKAPKSIYNQICVDCNLFKSGKLNFADPQTRFYVKLLVQKYEHDSYPDLSKNLVVQCECKK